MESLVSKLEESNQQLGELIKNARNDPEIVNFLCENIKLIENLERACKATKKIVDYHERNSSKARRIKDKVTEPVMMSKKLEEKKFVLNQLPKKLEKSESKVQTEKVKNTEARNIYSLTLIRDPSEMKRICYICRQTYYDLHFFYDKLCKKCAEFNFMKRNQHCDFEGKVAVVTGCRIKIGFEICLYLLRHNCFVIGTTRFAKECFIRYTKEADFDYFKFRLRIYSLDLRDLQGVDNFIKYLYKNCTRLDILINNAAQAIRRNVKFYENVLEVEAKPIEYKTREASFIVIQNESKFLHSDDNSKVLSLPAYNSTLQILPSDFLPNIEDFPANVVDKDGQQVDLSKKTSWNTELDEINFFEFAETQVINSWSPFLLCSKLKNLFLRVEITADGKSSKNEPKFIVNVSSNEGNFSRKGKTSKHVHNNMSKASLNMLSRCGSFYATLGIYMNGVDTGWVSEMNPNHLYNERRTVPLDEFDGAMRVLDPIIKGINENVFTHSSFFKDYAASYW